MSGSAARVASWRSLSPCCRVASCGDSRDSSQGEETVPRITPTSGVTTLAPTVEAPTTTVAPTAAPTAPPATAFPTSPTAAAHAPSDSTARHAATGDAAARDAATGHAATGDRGAGDAAAHHAGADHPAARNAATADDRRRRHTRRAGAVHRRRRRRRHRTADRQRRLVPRRVGDRSRRDVSGDAGVRGRRRVPRHELGMGPRRLLPGDVRRGTRHVGDVDLHGGVLRRRALRRRGGSDRDHPAGLHRRPRRAAADGVDRPGLSGRRGRHVRAADRSGGARLPVPSRARGRRHRRPADAGRARDRSAEPAAFGNHDHNRRPPPPATTSPATTVLPATTTTVVGAGAPVECTAAAIGADIGREVDEVTACHAGWALGQIRSCPGNSACPRADLFRLSESGWAFIRSVRYQCAEDLHEMGMSAYTAG